MSELNELIAKRQLLLAQCALQRATLAQNVAPWRPRLAMLDRGIAAVRYVRRYPGALAAMGLLAAALRGRGHRSAVWLERGWVLWQVGRGLLNRRPNNTV
jgi:hypothetical protein